MIGNLRSMQHIVGEGLDDIFNNFKYDYIDFNRWSSLVNALAGKRAIKLMDPDDIDEDDDEVETYISDTVLNLYSEDPTSFDSLLILRIEDDTLDTGHLSTCVDNVSSWTEEQQFVRIPILIYFLQLLEQSIKYGSTLRIVSTSVKPYINISFTSDDVDTGVISVDSSFSEVLAVLTNEQEIIHVDDSLVAYVDGVLTIDLSSNETVLAGIRR